MKKPEFLTDLQIFGNENTVGQTNQTGETQTTSSADPADAGQNDTLSSSEGEEETKISAEQNDSELEKEFESLIKGGKFEKVFAKRTQSIIDKRFKQYKTLEEENEELKQKLELSEKSNNGQQAPFGYKLIQKQADKQFSKWLNDGNELRENHPSFDFKTELKNENFARMLKSGVPVKDAYYALHHDEIIAESSKKVAEMTLKSVQANGQRPAENGTSSQGAFIGKTDVNLLTGKDIRSILKQVENGKRISF